MAAQTAAELVALAWKGVAASKSDDFQAYGTLAEHVPGAFWNRGKQVYLYVFADGDILVTDGPGRFGYRDVQTAVLRAPLTAETVASDEALVRALLTSAVITGRDDVRERLAYWASLGDANACYQPSESAARTALLDSLLATPETTP